ncbi:MAG: transporter related [Friedmanniella sp.]|nr:transporter related [Friedmanniella sp.]
MSTPLLVADRLSLVGSEGAVFTDVTVTVAAAAVTVVLGPAGSGRSALLLALCGRMTGTTGTLTVDGRPAAGTRDRRRADVALRRRTAVARIADLVQPEGQLTVGESLVERALVEGVPVGAADRRFAAAETLLETRFERGALADQLTAYDRSALAVALAWVRPADLVVLDDLDRSLPVADQRRLLAALARCAATGPALLVSTLEPTALPSGVTVVDLTAPAPPELTDEPAPATDPED